MGRPDLGKRFTAFAAVSVTSSPRAVVKSPGGRITAGKPVLLVTAEDWDGGEVLFCYPLALDGGTHPLSCWFVFGPAPGGSEVVFRWAGAVVYRTAASLRAVAEWHLARGTPHGEWKAMLALERCATLLAGEGLLGADLEDRWRRYQKLRALALAPGTAPEGDAALGRALAVLRELVERKA